MVGATPALAQTRGLSEYHAKPSSAPAKSDQELIADARRAAGIQDLKSFGVQQAPKEKPFPFLPVGLGLLAGLVAAPFAYRMYKSTRTDLEDQRTFGRKSGGGKEGSPAPPVEPAAPARLSRRPPTRQAGETRIVSDASSAAKALAPAASPRDAIWDAVTGARTWVTVEWVASEVGLSTDVVKDEIGALASEGYLKQARDSAGTPVFRVGGG